MGNFWGIHDLFWPAEPLSPTAGAGQAGLYAFAESDSFLLRDRGENRDHRILEDPAGIEVRLGETAIADAGPSQSVEMSEGFEDAFAGEAIERPKQEQVKTAMGGIAEHFLELNALTFSARLAVGVFAGDPNSGSRVASFPVGPHSERIHWRDHASFASTPLASSPCACCESHLFHLFGGGEIFQTRFRHYRQLYRSLQLRHVLSLLLQHPFHKSHGRAQYGRAFLPRQPRSQGGQGLLQTDQVGWRQGLDRFRFRQRLEHRQGLLGAAELRSQRQQGTAGCLGRHPRPALSDSLGEKGSGYRRILMECRHQEWRSSGEDEQRQG